MHIDEAVALTDIGRRMSSNEDAALQLHDVPLFAIADGKRSSLPAEVTLAVLRAHSAKLSVLGASIARRGDSSSRLAVSRYFEHVLNQANTRVAGDVATTSAGPLATSTVAAMTLLGRFMYLAHVGNSRGYLLRGGKLRLLTMDHTVAMMQLRKGGISREEYQRSPLRKQLTQAMGASTHVNPDIAEVQSAQGDVFVLTTDGVHEALNHRQMNTILAADGDLHTRGQALLKAANEAKGRDNASVVLVSIAGDEAIDDEALEVAELLGGVFLFEGLSNAERLLIAPYFEYQQYRTGDILCREGDPGDSFFVFISGGAEVTLRSTLLTELGVGDYAGEIALARVGKRTATITASCQTETLSLTRARFLELTRRRPTLGNKLALPLLENVGERVIDVTTRLRRIGQIMSGKHTPGG